MYAPTRLTYTAALLASLVAGCTGSSDDHAQSTADLASCAPTDETREGTLFGATVSSYATVSQGVVTNVGVIVPLSAIEGAPHDSPFQDDLVLDMPAIAKQQTFLSQLRVNWVAYGHGPSPYGAPHFDFHFYRGSSSEIEAIACGGTARFPPEILAPDHQAPTTCVTGMGYHAWPREDALPRATFTASMILGYTPTALVFIEPMITQATLLAKRDLTLAITPPTKSGGAATRYPTRMRVLHQPDGLTFRLDFDTFVDLD